MRPTDYKPEYCETIQEWGAQGKSIAWMAASLGQAKKTLYNWMKEHPEFLHAMERAQTLSQLWWEDAGQSGMTAERFNSSVWAKNMNCRFREDWRDETNINHGAQESLAALLGVIDGKAGRIPSEDS